MKSTLGAAEKRASAWHRAKPKASEFYTDEQVLRIWEDVKDGGKKIFPHGLLQNEDYRNIIVRQFVNGFKEKNNGAYPNRSDFEKAKLAGLLGYYGGSPFKAFTKAGYCNPNEKVFDKNLADEPWSVIVCLPNRYWSDNKNRIKATRWLVDKTKSEGGYPTADDFKNNSLSGLLSSCGSSDIQIIEEAGYMDPTSEVFDPVLDFAPWLTLNVPNGYWKDPLNREQATRWLLDITEKKPEELSSGDFLEYRLTQMFRYYGDSPQRAVIAAGFDVKPGNRYFVPQRYWKDPESRNRAVREFVESSGKPPSEITHKDMRDAGLRGVFQYATRTEALRDAGYDVPARPIKPK